MKSFLMVAVLSLSSLAQAALLSFEAGPQKSNGVVLQKTAIVNDAQGAPTDLRMDLLGAGLRSKTVLVAEAKVYVLQLFADNKAAYSRDANALTSLVQNSTRISLRIDMLRTVSASSLAASFKEALQANGYAIDTEISQILSLFEKSADASAGKTLSLLMTKNTKTNQTNLYYEDAAGKTSSMVGSADVMSKILSIWLGKSADSGLEKLKASLLIPVY